MKMLVDRHWVNKLHFMFYALFESATYTEEKCGTKRRKWLYYFKKMTHTENSKELREKVIKELFYRVVLCMGGDLYFRN